MNSMAFACGFFTEVGVGFIAKSFSSGKKSFLNSNLLSKMTFIRAWVECQPRGVEQLADSGTGLFFVWEFSYFKPASGRINECHCH